MSSPGARLAMGLLVAALLVLAVSTSACSPGAADVARMRDVDEDGPRRLADIVRERQGTSEVQLEAARSLVTLTRRGRHVGLELLVGALDSKKASSLQPLVDALVPALAAGMRVTPTNGEELAFAHKDASYRLASSHLAAVSATAQAALDVALDAWLSESDMNRLGDGRQRYSVRALLAYRGGGATKALLRHLDSDDDWQRAFALIAAEGDADTQREAGARLGKIVESLRSPGWREHAREVVRELDKRSRVVVTTDQLEAQVSKMQSQSLQQVFALLGRHRYQGSVATLLEAAEDGQLSAEDRAAALQALALCAQDLDDAQVDRVLALAAASPQRPGEIAARAYACIAHAPRGAPKLWALVEAPRSRGHRTRAAVALLDAERALAVEQLLSRLPPRAVADVPIAQDELTAYGLVIGGMTGGKDLLRPHLQDDRLGARLVALATYAGDRAALAPFEKDAAPLPQCKPSDPCEWRCAQSAVTTVGAWVRECLEAQPEEKPQPRGGHEVTALTPEQLLELLSPSPTPSAKPFTTAPGSVRP